MTQVPNIIKDKIYERVKKDLCPSRPTVHAKIGFSVSLGGLMSLFLCGQLGFGLTDFALQVHHLLMGTAGFWGCTFVCGILFAIVPVVALRLITSSMQFNVLVRNEWKAISGWILLFGGIIAYMNNQSDPVWTVFVWGIAAISSFGLFSQGLHQAVLIYQRVNS